MAKVKPPKPQNLTANQAQMLEARVFELVETSLHGLNPQFFLVAVDFEKEAGMWYLRVYVEKQDFSISLNDCEQISRHLDQPIEALVDALPGFKDFQYNLEVSSPGLFRQLRSEREFTYYKGRPVRAVSKDNRTTVEGLLAGYDAATQTVHLTQPEASVSLADEAYGLWLNPKIHLTDGDEAPHSPDEDGPAGA